MQNVKVLVACGGGIATSTFAASEIESIAKEIGVGIDISKHSLGDVPVIAKEYDVCFVTSKYAQDIGTPIIQVNGLITGFGEEECIDQIKAALLEISAKINA